MWPRQDKEPHWVVTEREQFAQIRDRNKDGKMDRDKVKEWIFPTHFNDENNGTVFHHLIHRSNIELLWLFDAFSPCLQYFVVTCLGPQYTKRLPQGGPRRLDQLKSCLFTTTIVLHIEQIPPCWGQAVSTIVYVAPSICLSVYNTPLLKRVVLGFVDLIIFHNYPAIPRTLTENAVFHSLFLGGLELCGQM